MQTPRASVVMSVYNGEPYLRAAVDSILAQTYTDYEFIIIDDASTDATAAILDGFDDLRIVRSRNEENIGLTRSLNKGLVIARGEYIARMDADDISLPERLAKQVDFLDTHPEIGVLGTAVRVIDGSGNLSHIWRLPAKHALIKWRLCFSDSIAHPTVMMRREALEQVRGYDTGFMSAQDYDLWRRLSRVTHLANLQEALLLLRRHETCVTHAHRPKQLENSIRISQMMISEVLGQDVPIQAVERLWNKESTSVDHVYQLADLIYSLFQTRVSDNTLSLAESRIIRRDAARQMARLVRQQACDGRAAWGVLIRACRLDPLVIGRAAVRKLRRIAREWLQ